MELKRKLVAPTPRRVRSRLTQLTKNPVTGKPMDDKTTHTIFKTLCYDDEEDDPWQYLPSTAQDYLASELLPERVSCAQKIKKLLNANSWYSHVSIDPCYSLLAKKLRVWRRCWWMASFVFLASAAVLAGSALGCATPSLLHLQAVVLGRPFCSKTDGRRHGEQEVAITWVCPQTPQHQSSEDSEDSGWELGHAS